MQESIYVFILHCRILTSPGAKQACEASADGAAACSWIPGFRITQAFDKKTNMFSTNLNVCM